MKFLFILLSLWLVAAPASACLVTQSFTPKGSVESLYATEVLAAKSSIQCSLYGLSNLALSADLVTMAQMGVHVQIGIDKAQAANAATKWRTVVAAGGEVRIKKTSYLEHNKYCVIDGLTLVSGSWNWSQGASLQDNNGMVVKDCPATVDAFIADFNRIWLRDKPS